VRGTHFSRQWVRHKLRAGVARNDKGRRESLRPLSLSWVDLALNVELLWVQGDIALDEDVLAD
jgi:hypothetical protein